MKRKYRSVTTIYLSLSTLKLPRSAFLSVALFTGLSAMGCANSTKGAIDVPDIPAVSTARTEQAPTNLTIAIKPLLDGRRVLSQDSSTSFTTVAYPQGTVGEAVSKALTKSLTQKGIIVTNSAPLVLLGEILEWKTNIESGIPKNIESNARIHIELVDTAGKRVFEGQYSGTEEVADPLVLENDVKTSLGGAMHNAVAQLMEDRDFLKTLWTNASAKQTWRLKREPQVLR